MQINGIAHCFFEQSGTFRDEFRKPTGFWFFNCEASGFKTIQKKRVKSTVFESRGIERSIIHSDYARNFICDCILDIEQDSVMIYKQLEFSL